MLWLFVLPMLGSWAADLPAEVHFNTSVFAPDINAGVPELMRSVGTETVWAEVNGTKVHSWGPCEDACPQGICPEQLRQCIQIRP